MVRVLGPQWPAAAVERRLAGVADDGRARVRQDPRRGRMDSSAGVEPAGADRLGRSDHRGGAVSDGGGSQRRLECRSALSPPCEMGAEPWTDYMVRRQHRQTVL